MLPDRVSNPEPLTYESGALPIALRFPAPGHKINYRQCRILLHVHVKSTNCLSIYKDFFLKCILSRRKSEYLSIPGK